MLALVALGSATVAMLTLVDLGAGMLDRVTAFFDPGSQAATKADINELKGMLRSRAGLQTPDVGFREINNQTLSALDRVLGPGSTTYKMVVEKLERGQFEEATTTVVRLAKVDLAAAPPATDAASDKLYLAGLLASRVNYPRAVRLLQQAIHLQPQNGSARAMLALIQLNQGKTDEAADTLQPIEGTPVGQSGMVQNILGLIALKNDQPEIAVMLFRSFLEEAQQSGQRSNQAAALGNLGQAYSALGDSRKAKDYYKLSIAANAGGNVSLDGNQYCNLGRIALEENKFDEANNYFHLAYDIFQFAEDTTCLPNTLVGLGLVANRRHRYSEAAGYLGQAMELADRRGQSDNSIVARANLAVAQRAAQLHPEADQNLLAALALALKSRDPSADERAEKVTAILLDPTIGPVRPSVLRTALGHMNRQIDYERHSGVDRPRVILSDWAVACVLGDGDTMSRRWADVEDLARRTQDATVRTVFFERKEQLKEWYPNGCKQG